jgi:hypothetical protein
MSWTNFLKPVLLVFPLSWLTTISLSQTQETKSTTASNATSKTASKNCGCDYFPMCDPTATKQFGQETYYGIKGSEKKGTYYNCKNGVVTIKWFSNEEYLADRKWEWRNDINGYGNVDYWGTETKINSKVLYKFNLPVGEGWNEPTYQGDFANFYKIEAKGQKITVNGKQYNEVLKLVMVTKLKMTEEEYLKQVDTYPVLKQSYPFENTVYYNGEVFKRSYTYYFDKYAGLIKEENNWEDLNAMVKRNNSRIIIDNSKHPLFKQLTENLWMAVMTGKVAGFEKPGKYGLAWAELGQVQQEIGYWRITGNWIEVSKTPDNGIWTKTYEIIKSDDNTIVLKKNSEVFSPSAIPLELKKE